MVPRKQASENVDVEAVLERLDNALDLLAQLRDVVVIESDGCGLIESDVLNELLSAAEAALEGRRAACDSDEDESDED